MFTEDDVIYAYTRAQAIDDGFLIDVTDVAREAGFTVPVAVTAAVWGGCVEVPQNAIGQDEAGRLWDVLWMCRVSISGKHRSDSAMHFELHVADGNGGPPPLVTLKAVCGPDDDGNPCITIMMPDED